MERNEGWYWVRKAGWGGEYGDWTPAFWKPEFRSWASVGFSGIPDSEMIVGVSMTAETQKDGDRWRWLIRHASLGFDGAPSWNAVVRLPVFHSDDQTITALVDSAMEIVGDA